MSALNELTVERNIAARPEAAWEVIANMEGYADLTTAGIAKVEVLEGAGEGMLRRCTNHKGESWTETCPVWQEGRIFQFVVDTSAPDYPYPVKALQGTWEVEPHGSGSTIRAKFEYELKYGLFGKMMNIAAAKGFRQDTEVLLDNWEAKSNAL